MAESKDKSAHGKTAGGFIRIAGLPGKVYLPELQPGSSKKHPCPDCHCCQGCSEERCRTCRSRGPEEKPDCPSPAA